MLQVKYYQDNLELVACLKQIPQDAQIVCPSPDVADAVREMVFSKWEVITIAKWIKELKIPPNSKKVGKSELMLHLASAFKKYLPEYNENLFFHSFELFTELRSFTLDLNMVASILEEIDERVKEVIKLFWAVLESQHFVDEHLLYSYMGGTSLERPIGILGFKHLSSIQIDMLVKLSSSIEIFIFIPFEVKKESLSIDWVNWLDSDKANDIPQKTSKANVYIFPKNKLNYYLLEYQKKIGSFDLSTLDSGKSLLELQELLVGNYNFKTKIDLFKTQKKKIFEKLREEKFLNLETLILYVNTQEKLAIKNQDFISVKLWQLINSSCEIYQDYLPTLDYFFFIILEEIIELNSPRNFFIPISENIDCKILSFDSLKFNMSKKPLVLILTRNSNPFSNLETKYPESIIKILKTLGPIRRGGLDTLFAKFEFAEALKRSEVTLFVEDGLLETDVGLRDVLNKFNVTISNLEIDFEIKKKIDTFAKMSQIKNIGTLSFSASKLQAYYDCPRKYYVNFIEKLDDRPLKKIGITPDEMGVLEHSIIAHYFQSFNNLNEAQLFSICQEKLGKHIYDHQIQIEFDEHNEVFYELVEYTANALKFLYELKEMYPVAHFRFESKLPENIFKINGFVDCIVETLDGCHIYDFKRSAASIGSKKDILNFEKLQLWIYYWATKDKMRITKIGYLNISDIEKSQIIEIENNEKINDFEIHLSELIKKFSQEKLFNPCPRNENSCRYCNVQMICPKEDINE